ncbi:MAG TPA: TonB-dependent receptor [Thermoanaerobaculia bacterium]|nr:TonB-dependent receptor [Thermoanaerobaculia bacterium]
MSRLVRTLFVLSLALGLAPGLSAQTTGGIYGRVTDEQQGGLPGVLVVASSPSLQGTLQATTDSTGSYRFSLLPPGTYQLSFELEGFAPEKRQPVAVELGRSTLVNVTLQPATSEAITVTGAAPVIDTSTTAVGNNFDSNTIESLPTGRNYSSVVQVAPGTASDAHPENRNQATITVYGSTGAENVYLIDGVNTTGVEYGFQGKELNFEFIDEVSVKTGGYEAEYGKSTGGIVNVITKSGGNDFHGDVFGYYNSDSLQSSADSVVSASGLVSGFTRKDYGVGLGGYLMKDRLWFFVAYDKVSNEDNLLRTDSGGLSTRSNAKSDRDLAAAKLTWNVAPGHSVVASFFQDPRDDTGAILNSSRSLNGDPSTYLGKQTLGGKDYALRYQGLAGSQWVISAQVARHNEENSVGPATAAGDAVQFRDVSRNFRQSGGFGLIEDKEFQRDFYGASVSAYLGHHEPKLGIEYEKQEATVVRRESGGQQVDVFANEVNPARPIYRHFYWTTPDATVANAPISRLVASPSHKNTTVYLQDKWSLHPSFTLSYGVRWDRQEIFDAAGVKQIDLKDDYAPRLGFVWDAKGDGSSKLYSSFGRFYEQIPMDLVIRSFSYERQPRIINYDPLSNRPDAQAEADLGTSSAILGGFTEPSDPNLKNQYINEYLLGYDRKVLPDVAVGVKLLYRKYGNVIEDFLCADDGTYCIGNPGRGIMSRIFTLDYSRTLPAPKPKRVFKGLELTATKRLSNHWQGFASYLYSKLDGNFDGLYAPFTNVGADPNITAAYDYFDFFTNGSDLTRITNTGPLSNDRRHQFKVSATYLTPWKLELGGSAYYRTGTPVTRYGYSDAYGRYEFFLTKRGAEGRTPATYEADLHLGYPIQAGPVRLNVLVDVFNLLNAQRAVLVDERWGFAEADNSSPTPVNPDYKKPVIRTPPTTVRVGLRVSF